MTSRSDYISLGGSPAEADALGLVNEPEPRMKDCPRCDGAGSRDMGCPGPSNLCSHVDHEERVCSYCGGLGEVEA